MKPIAKIGLVLGGYIAACLAAFGVLYAYQWSTNSAAAQASSGMYAFGDLLLFIATFCGCALVPTGAGLYFLIRWFITRRAAKEVS